MSKLWDKLSDEEVKVWNDLMKSNKEDKSHAEFKEYIERRMERTRDK